MNHTFSIVLVVIPIKKLQLMQTNLVKSRTSKIQALTKMNQLNIWTLNFNHYLQRLLILILLKRNTSITNTLWIMSLNSILLLVSAQVKHRSAFDAKMDSEVMIYSDNYTIKVLNLKFNIERSFNKQLRKKMLLIMESQQNNSVVIHIIGKMNGLNFMKHL